MKRITVLIILALSFVLLNQCGDKKHEALCGIWKIDFIEVNGSQLTGESIGKPLWEFNEEGGYLINIAGAIEKGSYKMKDNRLSLKSITYKEKAEQSFIIVSLDSSLLKLKSESEKNKVNIQYSRISGSLPTESD